MRCCCLSSPIELFFCLQVFVGSVCAHDRVCEVGSCSDVFPGFGAPPQKLLFWTFLDVLRRWNHHGSTELGEWRPLVHFQNATPNGCSEMGSDFSEKSRKKTSIFKKKKALWERTVRKGCIFHGTKNMRKSVQRMPKILSEIGCNFCRPIITKSRSKVGAVCAGVFSICFVDSLCKIFCINVNRCLCVAVACPLP